jgi:hypothetical protein
MQDLAKDFACPANSSLLNRRLTLHRYELTHRYYANRSVRFHRLARTGRVFFFCLVSGTGTRATFLDLRDCDHCNNHSRDVEDIQQSRSARVGRHHPDLQPLRLVQNRWQTSMVGSSVVNLLSDLLYHSLY